MNAARLHLPRLLATALLALAMGLATAGAAAAATPLFVSHCYSYATDIQPFSVAVGDLDGDGRTDAAVACFSSTTVSVLLGHADGTFGPSVSYVAATQPFAVAIGDLDGDGKLDLVVGSGADSISVLRNLGGGVFATRVNYAAPHLPGGVALGDFNGDGRLDIVTANRYANSASVFLNSGTGTFPTRTDISVGAYPEAIAVGDVNNDTKLDVVTGGVRPERAARTWRRHVRPTAHDHRRPLPQACRHERGRETRCRVGLQRPRHLHPSGERGWHLRAELSHLGLR
jgi:hypothetical protein